ncbi:hypothetical protein AC781_07035 [Akkermansia glycaniphila]|nr:hypothetical protein AC781_07035 [Akkermansia glycaniphila]
MERYSLFPFASKTCCEAAASSAPPAAPSSDDRKSTSATAAGEGTSSLPADTRTGNASGDLPFTEQSLSSNKPGIAGQAERTFPHKRSPGL